MDTVGSRTPVPLPEPLKLADGDLVWWLPGFLSPATADSLLRRLLLEVDWQQSPGLFGHPQPRLTAVCGDPGVTYTDSRRSDTAGKWFPAVAPVRRQNELTRGRFKFCLLNRYRSGHDTVGWHADNEPGLAPEIASLSLGASRRFRLRANRTRETLDRELSGGSLLLMGGTLQHHGQQTLARTRRVVGEPINLTFRHVAQR